MPLVALHHFRTHLLIRTHHIPVLFRIELAGEGGRVHHIAKHHGELAAFGFWGVWVGGWRGNLDRGRLLGRRLGCRLVRWAGRHWDVCGWTSLGESSVIGLHSRCMGIEQVFFEVLNDVIVYTKLS